MRELKSGEKFGKLTIIERDFKYESFLKENGKQCRPYYKCKCECGNTITVIVYNLVNGHTKSCGCYKKELLRQTGVQRALDLQGKVFNNIKVLYRDTSVSHKSNHTYWVCECLVCGQHKSIRGSDLVGGTIMDCGCMKGYRLGYSQLNDLTGKTYGHLHVLYRDMNIGTKTGEHARWICQCDICGRTESVASDVLLYGKDRCSYCSGLSNGEQLIEELLTQHNISFIRNRKFKDCVYPPTGGALRFDFIISNHDNYETYIIEYDGEQHFKEVLSWESKIDFQGRVNRDNYKNEWCRNNKIPIIRIPYTHLKNICINDLLPSKTAFLI